LDAVSFIPAALQNRRHPLRKVMKYIEGLESEIDAYAPKNATS
jgi:hypothetical protein